MKITVDVEGGGSLILEGDNGDEFFEILKGYADEKDLLTSGCMTSISPVQTVVNSSDGMRITV